MEKVEAQTLLNNYNISFYGDLKHGVKKLKSIKWKTAFVILYDGHLYLYKHCNSKKPKLVQPMSLLRIIEAQEKEKRPPYWNITLKASAETKPQLTFSAASQQEMNRFIDVYRNNLDEEDRLNTKNSTFSENSNRTGSSFQMNILPTVPPSDNITNSHLTEFSIENLYINGSPNPDELSYTSQPIKMKTQILDINVNEYLTEQTQITGNDELNNILFHGTREQAYKELSKCCNIGLYLIRIDGDRQILTVNCETQIVKFILQTDPSDGKVSINGKKNKFKNLLDLLSYYKVNDLPNHQCTLSDPYKCTSDNDSTYSFL